MNFIILNLNMRHDCDIIFVKIGKKPSELKVKFNHI
jgi:hypothetical protein